MKVLLMSLLKNSSYILTLLSLFGFLLTWQRSAFSLFFLIPIFLTLFWEFFLFLKLRKNIIKEATLIKGSLFYRISMGDFYLYIFSFFLAIFGLVSLMLGEASITETPGIIFNMTPSPGATSCLGNAERDAKLVCNYLGMEFNEDKFSSELL